jgi:hypothetical protein
MANPLVVRLDLSSNLDLCNPASNPVDMTDKLVAGIVEYLHTNGRARIAQGLFAMRGTCGAVDSEEPQTLTLEINLNL